MSYNPNSLLSEKLRVYYTSYFPRSLLCRWLSYGAHNSRDPYMDRTLLERREFSFILQGDIYVRHLSFAEEPAFLTKLQSDLPEKIDIGAIWKFPLRNRTSVSLADSGPNEPLERELVFDIDMDDYDSIRFCCKGAVICQKCWKFLRVACECISKVLDLSFGFKNILWVYSGRRGIHCWVSDGDARRLNNMKRKDLVEFINSNDKKHTPFIQIHREIVAPMFEEIIEEQQVFAHQEHFKYLNEIFNSKTEGRASLSSGNSLDVWRQFHDGLVYWLRDPSKIEDIERAVMFKFLYPRIDVNVSTGMNHLLKSPFSIHPKTQRVCVTFQPDQVAQFDFESVPTLDDILSERVSLQLYVNIFEEFVENCVNSARMDRESLVQFVRTQEAQSERF